MATTLPTITLPTFPTVEDVVAQQQNVIKSIDGLVTNFNTGGVTQTTIESVAMVLGSDASSILATWTGEAATDTSQGVYERLTQVQMSAYALTATGIFLDAVAADVGVTRKVAANASGLVQFSIAVAAVSTIVIPVGTIVSAEPADPTQAPILFATTSVQTISGGSTAAPSLTAIIATNAGISGSLAGGLINAVVSGPAGLLVTNPNPTSGGADIENDDSLRQRVLAAIPNAQQCTIVAIENDALSYPGITTARLLENTAPNGSSLPGTGQLYVDDGTGNLSASQDPNNASVIALQNALNQGQFRAAGVTINVQPSLAVFITLSLSVTILQSYINEGGSNALLQANLQTALFAAVNATPVGHPVTLSAMVTAAEGVPGVGEVVLTTVLIAGMAQDFVPASNQSPRCTNINSIAIVVSGVSPF